MMPLSVQWAYLKMVLRHKLLILKWRRVFGVGLWQALRHDLSKLSRSEWAISAQKHMGQPMDMQANLCFAAAVASHYRRNPHHWNYWVMQRTDGVFALPMPARYWREMVCDWTAFREQHHGNPDPRGWYRKNRDGIVLHETTRKHVERLMNEVFG